MSLKQENKHSTHQRPMNWKAQLFLKGVERQNLHNFKVKNAWEVGVSST
jgi:hypothetical protein